jgi:hypothetical protein
LEIQNDCPDETEDNGWLPVNQISWINIDQLDFLAGQKLKSSIGVAEKMGTSQNLSFFGWL